MINAALIERRRNELGLSQRAVARRLGVTSLLVARLEQGANGDELPLRLLTRLADVLALDPAELLGSPPTNPDVRDRDVRQLGALLATIDEPVALATLADALELDPATIDSLLDALGQVLAPGGLKVLRASAGVRLVPAVLSDVEPLTALLRGQHATHGLNASDARMLFAALNETLDPARLGNADQATLARLRNAGLIDHEGRPTDDVPFSLDLGDPTGGAQCRFSLR